MTAAEVRREALLIQVEIVVLKKLIHIMQHDPRYRAQHEKTIAAMVADGHTLDDVREFYETHVQEGMTAWINDELPAIVADIADMILADDHAPEPA